MAAKLAKVAMVTGIMAGVMVPALSANAASCNYTDRAFHVKGNSVTGGFTVPSGCYDDYSLVVYKAPNASLKPQSAQTLFSSVTRKFAVGHRSLTTNLPACGFYQVDLVRGRPVVHLKDG